MVKYQFSYKEVLMMARCPKLDFEDHGGIFMTHDKYICKLTGLKMDVDDTKVKFVCNAEYGEEYEKCPVYQSR